VIELGDVILKFIPAGDIYVPGADESQQASALTLVGASVTPPAGAASGSGGLPYGMKLAAIGSVAAIAVALAVVIATRGGTPEPAIASGGLEAADSAMRTLLEAKALLDKGEIDAAVRRAAEIPQASNARKTADYRQIQGAWADALFAKAAASQDAAQKRALLDQISRATTVDSVRRKRAASDLLALDAESVDVSELPSAPKKEASHAGTQTSRTTPGSAEDPALDAAKAGPTLVRKNPFDDEPTPSSAQDSDHSKLLSAKATLQQKVRSGQASDRDLKMLRAVCKQLGDVSCSN